jgi:hypothetical protein
MVDYYDILEVPPNATHEEIKQSWREQLQVWHPDRFRYNSALRRKAEERTKEINEAYGVLGNKETRAVYDRQRRTAPDFKEKETSAKTDEPAITDCPNPSCTLRLRIRKVGRIRVSCPECGCAFIFDTEKNTKEDIQFQERSGTEKKLIPAKWIPGIIAATLFVVGKHAGIHLLIPVVGTVIIWEVGEKFTKLSGSKVLPIFSVQGGQLLWFTTALFLTPAQWTSVPPDISILAIGLTVLFFGHLKRAVLKRAILFLLIYQGFSFLIKGSVYIDATVGSSAYKALLIHLLWSGIALWLMADYLWGIGQRLRAMGTAFMRGKAKGDGLLF